jgi:hypothetical protein
MSRQFFLFLGFLPGLGRHNQIILYLQLDCSFRGSYPFAYSVPRGVLCNQVVPLALLLTVTQNKFTYQWFLDDRQESVTIHPIQFPPKPVLSD